jgi:hypothetical protein
MNSAMLEVGGSLFSKELLACSHALLQCLLLLFMATFIAWAVFAGGCAACNYSRAKRALAFMIMIGLLLVSQVALGAGNSQPVGNDVAASDHLSPKSGDKALRYSLAYTGAPLAVGSFIFMLGQDTVGSGAGALYLASTIYDIATTRRSAVKYNRGHGLARWNIKPSYDTKLHTFGFRLVCSLWLL